MLAETDGWRARAACHGHNPDDFHPTGDAATVARQEAAAKAVCAGCEVRADCLAYALTARPPIKAGIWGGMTEPERRRQRRFWREVRAVPTYRTPGATRAVMSRSAVRPAQPVVTVRAD